MTEVSEAVINEHQSTFTFSQDDSKTNPQNAPVSIVGQIDPPKVESPSSQVQNINQQGSPQSEKQAQPPQSQQQSPVEPVKLEPAAQFEVENMVIPSTMSPQPGHKRSITDEGQYPLKGEDGQIASYHQLTMKLESALSRIATSKKSPRPSYQFQSNFMERVEECQDRKKKFIKQQRSRQQQQIDKTIQSKPAINKHSQRIAQEMGYEPIYERVDRLMEQRRKKQEEAELAKRKQQQEEEEEILEEQSKLKKPNLKAKDYDVYFEQIVNQNKKKEDQNRIKQEEKVEKQLSGVTFTPTLNPKSQKMVASHPRVPISERQPPMKKKFNPGYTFTPRILKKRQNY